MGRGDGHIGRPLAADYRNPMRSAAFLAITAILLGYPPCLAGIYIREETLHPQGTPANLGPFLDQLIHLRGYGPAGAAFGGKETAQREDFLAKVKALRAKPRLTDDEKADLGGYLLYLKQTSPQQPPFEEAVSVLEAGHRGNPRHFALAANLGTAYQLTGKLDVAERCLETAVALADETKRPMERLHLSLVQRRLREALARGQQPGLDLLFGRPADPFRFVGPSGQWDYGRLSPAQREKLPGRSPEQAIQQIQQLLVWLPDDGRLHWQLGEWALVMGQTKEALKLLDQSVNTFRMSHRELKQHWAKVQELVHWQNFVAAQPEEAAREAWIVQTLCGSLSLAAPGDGMASSSGWIASAMPPRLSLAERLAQFEDSGSSEPAKPFVMRPWHWGMIALGILLAVALLLWQMQQFFRPRRRVSFR
jgi:tetratricopeptide (TPR) repeat protein